MSAFAQVPINDLFDNRLPLGRVTESISAVNTLATNEPAEPAHRGSAAAKSLWWRWTAPLDGYVVVTTTNSVVHSRIAVYDFKKVLSQLSPEPLQNNCAFPTSLDRYEFDAVQGLDYNMAVDGVPGESGSLQLDLKVFTRPEFIIQPQPTNNVTAGQRARLDSCALGARPMTNEWQFSTNSPNAGFNPVPGGTGRSLDIGTFGVVAKKDDAWYRVVVRNQYGAATSSVARVIVNECATPTGLSPLFVSNNVGKTVSFAATAVGTPPLFFRWQFRPTNQYDFIDLPGANSNSLTLTNISTDDAGDYRFLVSNVACTNQPSTNAMLLVSTSNALVLNSGLPINQTVITNFNVTNQVRVVEGYQPIRYQWWFTSDAGATRALVGETAPDNFLAKVQETDAGFYWAVVSNRYVVVASRQAHLTVETRPPNDNFGNRTPIFPNWNNLSLTNTSRTTVSGWNKNGTSEVGEPSHQGRGPSLSVWWSFQAPVRGHVIVFLTTVPPGAGVLAAYTGSSVSNLTPVLNRTNRTDMFDFVATTNTEYLFAVESLSGAYKTDNIGLDFTFEPKLGAPVIVRDIPDRDLDMFMLGDFGGAGGCRTFSQWTIEAVSLDDVVNYQWEFSTVSTNGPWVDLPGKTNGNLVLDFVTRDNQGWYRARVSNLTESVYSKVAHLTVGVAPIITLEPTNIFTNACTSGKFTVEAESCGAISYQWYQNGAPVAAANAIGVHSNILAFSNLSPTNEGDYYVTVANANLSVTSAVAHLTLRSTPQISIQPQSLTRHGCDPAAFSVGAFANCALAYQWYFQGQPLSIGTNSSLAFASVDTTNAGTYFAVISTPFAAVTSAVVSLTVQTNPVVLTSPVSQTARACDIVNLDVQAQGEPPCSWITYQWQLAGTNVDSATNRVYSFEAQAETAGSYRVILSNRWTAVTSAVAVITVNAQPQITKQPNPNQRIRVGDNFTNQIVITTCGSLSYIWQFKSPSGATFTNITPDAHFNVGTNGWLTVTNAQTNDSGYYQVIVSNTYSAVTSAVAFVRVVAPPLNDHFTNAFSLGSTNLAIGRGHNEFATSEPGEPSHGLQPPASSVWWFWTNPVPSLVTVDLGGSDIDTTLGVYVGSSVSDLTTLALDDDGGANGRSRVTFMAGRDKVLYVAVDGKRGAQGTNLVVSISTLTISNPPVITEQPLSLAASAGQTVSFTNRSYGSPEMTIQWYGTGTPRTGTTQIVGLTNYLSILTLTNVSTNDDGVYYAALTNDQGSVTTKLATLTLGSIVRGLVTDATKTTPAGIAVGIPGVHVSIGNVSTVTDQDGNYELVGVTTGSLRADFIANKTRVRLSEEVQFWNLSSLSDSVLIASKDGFYDYVDSHFEVGAGRTVAKRFSMSPIFKGMRFVLNWTNAPADLDLYLHFPSSIPIPYPWIDYLFQNRGSTSQPPYAIRDADVSVGWGPETITIHQFYPGTYSLYARKFLGQGGARLTQSDAQLVVYQGGELDPGSPTALRPLGSIDVPTQGTNDWWYICDVDGLTTNITWINQLLSAPPSGLVNEKAAPAFVTPIPKQSMSKAIALTNNLYDWDFGDGSPLSHEFEPRHAYAEPGWKTVVLTVSERLGNPPKASSLARTNYILVENIPPVVSITNPLPYTTFRAGDSFILQSEASGVDDQIQQVDYYLSPGSSPNRIYLGTATNAPFTLTFANTNYLDVTNQFFALARDVHGAATWSQPLPVVIRDLTGDILIIRNFPSVEITTMASFLNEYMIPYTDPFGIPSLRIPIVRVLDQEVLRFDLVKSFKLIIWNDQGQTAGGLTDNDVSVLKQAYDTGIPLYLIGEKLCQSKDNLFEVDRLFDWIRLTGFQSVDAAISPPLTIRGIKYAFRDGLFYGWDRTRVAGTNLTYANALERVQLANNEMDVVADVPGGFSTNSPVMLRYPRYSEPDFGQTRRLVQNFRPAWDQYPEPPANTVSATNRRTIFLNGVAWLLRLFECDEFNMQLVCLSAPGAVGGIQYGWVGQPMTNIVQVTQNGECEAGGVVAVNHVAPQLTAVSADVVPSYPQFDPPVVQVRATSNLVTATFAQFPLASYDIRTVVVPGRGGWATNTYTVSRGMFEGNPCSQILYIRELGLGISLDRSNRVHIIVSGGLGRSLMLQSSTNLHDWQNESPLHPDRDPYDVPLPNLSGPFRFYRFRTSD